MSAAANIEPEETNMTAIAKVAEPTPVNEVVVITPMTMIDRAVQQGASIEVLEKLMNLQERHDANMARKAFDAAVAEAKGEIPPIVKDRKVGFESQRTGGTTSYSHESLGQIASVVDPILNKHGLSYRYRATQENGRVSVTCVLSHRDGYSEETTLSAGADDSGKKNSIQAIGSTTTYLQRYTLKLALGLSTTDKDDDGASSDEPALSGAAVAAIASIGECKTLADLNAWRENNDAEAEKLERNEYNAIVRAWKERRRDIQSATPEAGQ